MARTTATLPAGSRITDYISLGVIARWFPRHTVERVLRDCGRASRRQRDLPAPVMVYYVIALALYMHSSYREVLRCLLEGLQWLQDPASPLKVAGDSGISQARSRLGVEPVEQLHDELVRPLATNKTRGSFYRQWQLVSLDGSTLDVADQAANRTAFGYPGASRGASAFPQLRFVSLLDNGTHVLFGSRMGPCATGEITLAQQVLPALTKGMLCLADRNFLGYQLWRQASQTGAQLLWRAKKRARLDVLERFADGSYRSAIYASPADRRQAPPATRGARHRVSARGHRRRRGVLSTGDDDSRSRASAGDGVGGAVLRTLGNRGGVRRTQDAFARCADRAAQQDAGVGAARVLRITDGAFRDPRVDARGGGARRPRSGSIIVPACGAGGTTQAGPRGRDPPPRDQKAFDEAVLRELLDERTHSSRGMRRPRGVKRKMSNYQVRSRGAVSRKRTDFASCVRILK